MKLFVALFLLLISRAATVKHSLKYFYTSSTEVPNFPEFVIVGLLDEVQIEHYDSKTRRFVPKQDWMNKITEEDPTFWETETVISMGNEQIDKANIEILKQRFNQTEGLHIVQVMTGCQWDDDTDEVNGFEQYGYDGEDFLSFDMKTETWVAPRPQAVTSKHKLDNNRGYKVHQKHYLTKECHRWLMKFLNYGKSSLMTKDLPSVSLLQKTPSSPVTCHATGFYPDRAQMFWRRDEEELHEGVVRGEILPNHDGSFQMSVDLDLSGVKDEDWWRYSCVFQLAGVQDEVLTTLDKRVILTNWRSDEGFLTAAAVVGTVVSLLLLTGYIIGPFLLQRSKNQKFRTVNTTETSEKQTRFLMGDSASDEHLKLERKSLSGNQNFLM